ncbi:MAG: WcaF family extracellular polysaccharide biosynthesis acetyltransferase [Acidobacteriota bacterium]|nr:WcaF family extracellular polysaccharide biosynthesis acetyltransferase [Acidobacteriota bacterium]
MQQSHRVDLSRFANPDYEPGRSWFVQVLWFLVGLPLLRSAVIPSSGFRRGLLRLFGAKVGKGAVIKPGFRVKYPWLLRVGDHCWLGEDAWLDNLAMITLGNHVCISQAAYLCTGNHDWSDPAFRLIVQPIQIEDGAWVGARAALAPGTVIGEGAIVGLGAVVSGRVPPNEIYSGNPAKFIRRRHIGSVVVESPVASSSR